MLVFEADLAKEGKLGFWRWFWGAWGIGTYKKNDQVDVPGRSTAAPAWPTRWISNASCSVPLRIHSREGVMRTVIAVALGALLLARPPRPRQVEQPAGAQKNLKLVSSYPEAKYATAINFLQYGKGQRKQDVLVATGRFGLITYDLSNPAKPRKLDTLDNEALRLTGDPPTDFNDGRTTTRTRTRRTGRTRTWTSTSGASSSSWRATRARSPAPRATTTASPASTSWTCATRATSS